MLLVAQMIGHLGLQRSLQDGFGQFLEQAVLPDDILGFLVVGQQLVDQLLVDSLGIFILLFFPQPFTQFSLFARISAVKTVDLYVLLLIVILYSFLDVISIQ